MTTPEQNTGQPQNLYQSSREDIEAMYGTRNDARDYGTRGPLSGSIHVEPVNAQEQPQALPDQPSLFDLQPDQNILTHEVPEHYMDVRVINGRRYMCALTMDGEILARRETGEASVRQDVYDALEREVERRFAHS